jgi:hypothetical protein
LRVLASLTLMLKSVLRRMLIKGLITIISAR